MTMINTDFIDPALSPLDQTHNKDLIQSILKILSPRCGQILMDIAYYGMTYTECSIKYNVCLERIRQLYFKSIRTIQSKSYLLI